MVRFSVHSTVGQDNTKGPAGNLQWRSYPLVDDFPRSLLCVAVFVGFCVLTGLAFGGVGYGVIAAVLVGGSLGRYFLPTYFALDEDGVTIRMLGRSRTIPWTDVKRISVRSCGMFLSPFPAPSRLDSFRGAFLRFRGNADEVTRFVESKAVLGK